MVPNHPKRADIQENVDSFFVSEFEVYKAIMSLPNGSGAGQEKIVPLVFKDLISKSNGNAGLNFLKSLTKLLNPIGDGKIPEELRLFLFLTSI